MLARTNKRSSNSKNLYHLLVLLCGIEILCHRALLNWLGSTSTSWIYLLIGIAIGIIIVRLSSTNQMLPEYSSHPHPWHKYIISFFLILQCTHYLLPSLSQNALSIQDADMLPVLHMMAERWCRGQEVYAKILTIWDGTDPIYLPALWLPITISHWLDIDVRLITVALGLGSILLCIQTSRSWQAILLSLALYFTLVFTDYNFFHLTQEGIILFYYAGLVLSFGLRRYVLFGLLLACCLFSRFSLGPWALVVLPSYIIAKERAPSIKVITALSVGSFICASAGKAYLYLPKILSLSHLYLTAIHENAMKYQSTMQHNLGLVKYFFPDHMDLLHLLSYLAPFGICTLGLISYVRNKSSVQFEIYWIAILKLSLVAVYNLILIPYGYLFYTSTVVSVAATIVISRANYGDQLTFEEKSLI